MLCKINKRLHDIFLVYNLFVLYLNEYSLLILIFPTCQIKKQKSKHEGRISPMIDVYATMPPDEQPQ